MARTIKTKNGGEIRADSPFARRVILARKCKRAKMSRDEFVTTLRTSIAEAAKEGGWLRSEAAMAMADVTLAADEVWPEEKTK